MNVRSTRGWWVGQVCLWLVQLLLALLFLRHGYVRTFVPVAEMDLAWTKEVPVPMLRTIGVLELAAAIGLLLPSAIRVLPWLTPLAAAGLVVLMVGAIGFHLVRGSELTHAIPSAVFGSLAAFVAWGRTRWLPIRQRGKG